MTEPTPRLNGKIALVTGGAKRLGRAIALALAQNGADVIIHYFLSREEAEKTAQEIRDLGVNSWTVQADLAQPAETEDLISRCRQACNSPINLLINNASIFPTDRLMDFSPDDLAASIQVNAMAPLQISRSFSKQTPGGCIINLLDCRMVDYDSRHVTYHLSKRMLHAMTKMMAIELAPKIRVNAVAPGLILPPEGKDEEYLQQLAHTNPLNDIGNPGQIADAVLYLLQAEFVTGQVIFVDGGRHIKGSVYG